MAKHRKGNPSKGQSNPTWSAQCIVKYIIPDFPICMAMVSLKREKKNPNSFTRADLAKIKGFSSSPIEKKSIQMIRGGVGNS